MLTVAYKPFMLSVIVLNVVMLSVVVPSVLPLTSILFYFWTQWFALNAAHQQMSEASKFGRNYIIIPLFFRRCPFRQVAEGQRERDRTRPGRLLNCAMKCKMWEGRNSLRTVIPKHLLTFGYYAYRPARIRLNHLRLHKCLFYGILIKRTSVKYELEFWPPDVSN